MKNKTQFSDFENDAAFDEFLRARAEPVILADLNHRIFLKALRVKQPVTKFDLKAWFEELWADFMPLRPAYALASVLLAGFLFGALVIPTLTAEDNHLPQILLADEGDMP